MLSYIIRFLLAILVPLSALAACGSPANPGASSALPAEALALATPTTPLANRKPLAQGLALLPAESSRIFYTNWTQLKQQLGAADLSSRSSLEQRQEFALSLAKQATPFSAYALAHFMYHADIWGWDSTDLQWELNAKKGDGSLYILKFNDEFDFAPVRALFEERGFERSDQRGAVLYSRRQELADWLTKTEFAILNTAILPEQGLMLLSVEQDLVREALDLQTGAGQSSAALPPVVSVATHLADTAAAYISLGTDACADYSALDPAALLDPQAGLPTLAAPAGLRFYAAMGVGYWLEKRQPHGLIVFTYLRAEDAAADLEQRRQIATKGVSQVTRAPYRESRFSLEQAVAQGPDLLLRVKPRDASPRALLDLVVQRDMAFAACG